MHSRARVGWGGKRALCKGVAPYFYISGCQPRASFNLRLQLFFSFRIAFDPRLKTFGITSYRKYAARLKVSPALSNATAINFARILPEALISIDYSKTREYVSRRTRSDLISDRD